MDPTYDPWGPRSMLAAAGAGAGRGVTGLTPAGGIGSRRRLGTNADYSYCITSYTGSCYPCEGGYDDPCMTDDQYGRDDTKCSLPYYYFGNIYDTWICGDEIRPYNIGLLDMDVVINNVPYTIGQILVFMQINGQLTVTVRLDCPWMAVVNPGRLGAALALSIRHPNGTTWTRQMTTTDSGSQLVSCSSYTVQAKAIDPELPGDNGCDEVTYGISVSFMTEMYMANPAEDSTPATCTIFDETTTSTLVH
ncbi:hypothetical protein GPECTOR_32g439 [Gonium pectorale]|uniref:Uncharacterized protein n=1 Tax=Gonium pectorale TaxID=33097 RepID=A0A150GDA0_GONPE|nr:hypothetical protein GPECTOR_32g439 [Gonium pectorale]|eukprot:KXZ47827.1 hypothetical protein GPECTOR_32g439 [Gonium pectorale]